MASKWGWNKMKDMGDSRLKSMFIFFSIGYPIIWVSIFNPCLSNGVINDNTIRIINFKQ